MKTALTSILALVCFVGTLPATEETVTFEGFGTVHLYYASPHPSRVALFVSGDGGWNLGVVDMARELVTLDALVVGVDITQYLRHLAASSEECLYPAADFETLSKSVQMKLGYSAYQIPVLVGYSSGATLVYATLVQAPYSTFQGALSLGFCPDLMLARPMCRGSGLEWVLGPKDKGYIFQPAKSLEDPWIALQGETDRVCDPKGTQDYAKRVPHGEVIMLPKVGHGYSVPRNWMPQFREAFARIAKTGVSPRPKADVDPQLKAGAEPVKDLPLIEVPASDPASDLMAVHVTGDGGWGVTDRGIAKALAEHGIPVVGLSALQYFWKRRTPEETASDVDRIIRHYTALWNKKKVIVIGYSFGADVLPFVLNRLPNDTRAKIQLVAFLGLSQTADFEFHLLNWLTVRSRPTSLPVLPEVEKLKGMRILCFYGTEDKDALCPSLGPGLAESIPLQSGHRFGHGFEPVVEAILAAVNHGQPPR
jgi:type IV secretory pathway VirJ component